MIVQVPISVIIPVFNGGRSFLHCLEHISALNPAPIEAIVVANGDTDGSRYVAQEFVANTLTLAEPVGPAFARNVGARHACGDILFFVDADVALPPDVLRQIATTFEQEPGLAALIGSYDSEPAAPNFLSQYKNLIHHYTHQTSREEASTFWGACGAIRRSVFVEMGGFDERFRRPSVEDIELGYRLKEAGHQIRMVKSLQVKHLKRWTAGSMVSTDFFQRALPWAELILRDHHLVDDLNLNMSSRVSVALVYALLGALALVAIWPVLWPVAALTVVGLLLLNAPLYRFFWRKRGPAFALRSLPWHWLYFLYSGLAFALANVRHLFQVAINADAQPAADS